MSMPSSTQKIVSPVSASPLTTGQFIAERPRYFGSSEGWYWIAPCVAASSTFLRTMSVTKAKTISSGSHAR